MDKVMFLLWISVAILLNEISGAPQQGTFFNQNPFNRIQPINRPQTFQPPPPPILPQAYNPRNFVPITAYQNEVSYDGSFSYGYTAGDGTTAQAQGYLKNAGVKDLEAQVVQGSYSYTSPDGTPIRVTYVADENGFRAEGAHLPTPPPIPDAIAKSLQYIARVQPLQSYNQNLNPFSNQQPFQQQQRQNQLTPIQLQQQQQQQLQQQQQKQQQQLQQQQQPQQQQLQQQQRQQQQQQEQQQQQQQQRQQQQQQQQLQTQQLFQNRQNQIPQFGFNKFGRFKK